ncbi:hypothetical protein ACLOJK_014869 [Asimina triloba]
MIQVVHHVDHIKSTASNPLPDTATTSPARMPPSATGCTSVSRCPDATACTARPPSSRLACQQCLPSMLDADVGNTLAYRLGRGTTPSTHGNDRHPRIEDSSATVPSNIAYN